MKEKKLPHLPKGREILYVPISNEFMVEAKKTAQELSLDQNHPTGAVVIQNGKIIGRGANGSDYHEQHGCKRKELNIPTGEGYELCEGCNPRNHAEQSAIRDAKENGKNVKGGALYLWGHWWCCESCWDCMIENGIRNVYLEEK